MSSLFAELKRRKVVRVAVVYVATAFAVLQAADIMLPRMGVPEWAMGLLVAFVVLGFPLYQVHRALLWDGRVNAAGEVLERMQRLARGDERWGVLPSMRQACAEGRRDDAEQILANFDADDISQRWHLLMLLGEHAAATELLMELERDGRIYPLASFLIFLQFDPSPFPSLMRILEREQVRRPPPVALPFACPPRETGS